MAERGSELFKPVGMSTHTRQHKGTTYRIRKGSGQWVIEYLASGPADAEQHWCFSCFAGFSEDFAKSTLDKFIKEDKL